MTSDEISLREYFTKWLETLEENISAKWKAHDEVHKLLKEALDLAMVMLKEKLAEMNNFREQQNQERGEFLKQQVYDIEHRALEKRVADHGKWIDNMNGRLWALGAFILAINVAVGLLLKFWGK
jgi:carbonic anhydrase